MKKFILTFIGIFAFIIVMNPGTNGEPSIMAGLITELFQLDALGNKIANFTDYIK